MALAMSHLKAQEQTDEQLMQLYAKGDAKAFEMLYLKHKGALYRYFVRQLADKQLAEDLYQETWSRVIRAAANYEPSAKFTTWVYRIAHNLLIDHVRSVKPVEAVSLDDVEMDALAAEAGDKPDLVWEENQKSMLLKSCISLLPHVQKEAFILNIEMGFTALIISDIAGVTLEATKSRIRYAYQSLKNCVDAKWREAGHE
ncbi:sigma-70 family RNA polymerase sigma factor [Shewanella sp. A25]|nr:sigma-70 family RNA polymerase sigma factor [Shewanella shenzhenensis]